VTKPPKPGAADGERLQKLISTAGVASRRAAERLIVEGRVTVNGVTVTELGTRADPSHDEVRVDGRRLPTSARRRYVLLNKPRGFVTTRHDPEGRPTVMDLVRGLPGYLYPVGRLDYDSEGLLLLTDDGDLAARLMHPRHGIARVYEARVRGVPDARDIERLAAGISIEGRMTRPADVRLAATDRGRDANQSLVVITLREGRSRQVRKMCDAIGHPVVRLRRTRIGPISDPRLRPRQFRELTAREVALLKKATERTPP
jgi:pseudouridine synthase